jgi:hypothetical protein
MNSQDNACGTLNFLWFFFDWLVGWFGFHGSAGV